jgi:hypothetical protein
MGDIHIVDKLFKAACAGVNTIVQATPDDLVPVFIILGANDELTTVNWPFDVAPTMDTELTVAFLRRFHAVTAVHVGEFHAVITYAHDGSFVMADLAVIWAADASGERRQASFSIDRSKPMGALERIIPSDNPLDEAPVPDPLWLVKALQAV